MFNSQKPWPLDHAAGRLCIVYGSKCGPGSSVGIATEYELDGSGIESRWGEIFCLSDRPWGPPSLLYNGYRIFPGVKYGRSVLLTTYPLLVPRSWKSRAVTTGPAMGTLCLLYGSKWTIAILFPRIVYLANIHNRIRFTHVYLLVLVTFTTPSLGQLTYRVILIVQSSDTYCPIEWYLLSNRVILIVQSSDTYCPIEWYLLSTHKSLEYFSSTNESSERNSKCGLER